MRIQECTDLYVIFEKLFGPLVGLRWVIIYGTRGLGYWRIVCLLHILLAPGGRIFQFSLVIRHMCTDYSLLWIANSVQKLVNA